MKNIFPQLALFLCLALALFTTVSAQDNGVFDLTYDINRVYPFISITKEELNDASSLIDLNDRYKADWVKEYVSVEVVTSQLGESKTAMSENDVLSPAQKDLMQMADVGTDIFVRVLYYPDNNLTGNEIKETNFTFTVEPEQSAAYPDGPQQLKQYLKESAMDKLSTDSFKRYQLTAVKFTVNETGEIVDPHIFESSKDETTDAILLETVCNMPNWQPATYANGTRVQQDFVLTVGDMESCVVNLLSIRKYPLD